MFLLLMDSKSATPVNLILTRIPVPPICIRPSVASELKIGTNEDSLTMTVSKIAIINEGIRKAITGANIQQLMDVWEYLQLHCGLYINGDMSGIPKHIKVSYFSNIR